MRNFRHDQRGLAGVIIMFLVSVVLFSICWYAVGIPFILFKTSMESLVTFPAPFNAAVAFISFVFAIIPYIILLALIGYVIASAIYPHWASQPGA
jgi:hypothetical protein